MMILKIHQIKARTKKKSLTNSLRAQNSSTYYLSRFLYKGLFFCFSLQSTELRTHKSNIFIISI
jgi:hypothetical protein